MRLPVIHGLIRRRLLVDFRVDAEVMSRFPPSPFRPKLHRGHAIAPLAVEHMSRMNPYFRRGSVHFDHALLMRDLTHQYYWEPDLFTE